MKPWSIWNYCKLLFSTKLLRKCFKTYIKKKKKKRRQVSLRVFFSCSDTQFWISQMSYIIFYCLCTDGLIDLVLISDWSIRSCPCKQIPYLDFPPSQDLRRFIIKVKNNKPIFYTEKVHHYSCLKDITSGEFVHELRILFPVQITGQLCLHSNVAL